MMDLAGKALERIGKKRRPDTAAPSTDPKPLKVAMKEAFEASKADDFERFFTAFESALDIRLAEMGHESDEDPPSDVEPYELDEIE